MIRLGRSLLALLILIALLSASRSSVTAQSTVRYFGETGHTVSGRFLQYWEQHDGLALQGYPLSEAFRQVSTTDGKPYLVQYFERAVFEYHPENAPPYDVLLTLLGADALHERYPNGGPAGQTANQDNPHAFPQTGHTVGGGFWVYWQSYGGLAQFGYPLTDEFQETSRIDGKLYTMQYFERAVFEYHPTAPMDYRVMLSLLGVQRYQALYGTTPGAGSDRIPPAPDLPPPSGPVLFDATFATPDLTAWQPLPGYPPATWQVRDGDLQQSGDAHGAVSQVETVLVAGDPRWRDFVLEAQFYTTSNDPVGVLWRQQGNLYYRAQFFASIPAEAPQVTVARVEGSRVFAVGQASPEHFSGFAPRQWHTVRVLTQGSHQQVSLDGVTVVDAQDPELVQGQIGLYAFATGSTAFAHVRVQQLGP